jgi:hypothetical protein
MQKREFLRTELLKRQRFICLVLYRFENYFKDGKLDIEGKKVFRVIEKYRKEGAFEKQRFEPAEKSINKTKKPFLTAENPMWLGR